MSEPTLTQPEAELVAALLKLYEAAGEDFSHRRECECSFCEAHERCGEMDAKIFKSLSEKLNP